MAAHKKKKEEILIPTGFRLSKAHKAQMKAEKKRNKKTPSVIIRECLDKRYSRKRKAV